MTEQTTQETTVSIPEDDFAAYEAYRDGKTPEDAPAEVKDSEAADEDEPESADDSETSDEEEQDDDEVAPKKHKGGFQRRIDQLSREVKELRARNAELAGTKPAARQEAIEKPKPEDFKNSEEYFDKLADYKLEQRELARAAEAERKSTLDNWQSQLKEARGRIKDFDSIVNADIAITPAMQECIITSEHGADVAYYLGKNPKEAERITQLPPLQQVRALGRLEASFAKSSTPEPVKVTRAPEPIKPVSKAAKTSAPNIHDESLAANDFSAWEKAREAGLKRKR